MTPLATPEEVAIALSLPRARGLALSSTEVLKIVVDRSKLPPGAYLARLKISASTGQERSFSVVLEAAGLEGQWVGKVVIESVDGRRNPVADIDLHLHLTQDNLSGSRQLRGIIDSRETLLWAEDAQLLGHFLDYAPGGGIPQRFAHRFVLEGGVTLEPGDINSFPFDSFPLSSNNPGTDVRSETDSVTGLRFTTNSEGDRHYFSLPGRQSHAKFTNPLPTFISRDLQLIGMLTGTEGNMPVLTGEYTEIVRGLLSRPIELKGKFRLIRRSFSPYRPASYFHDTPEGGIGRAASSFYAAEITVDKDLLIDRVVVVVAQDASDRSHSLRLTAPDGTEVVLHNREAVGPVGGVIFDSSKSPIDVLAVLDPPELRGAAPLPAASAAGLGRYQHLLRESLASYVVRPPRQSLSPLIGKAARGTWTLRWEHSEQGRVNRFKGWSLLIYGTPIQKLSGQAIIEGDSRPERFADVRLDVVGPNADVAKAFTRFDPATGQFTIANVPGLRLNVLVTKPGYPQVGLDQLDKPSHPRGFVDHLEGFLAGSPGSENLTVVLRPSKAPPRITVSHRMARAAAVDEMVIIPNVTLAIEGAVPEGAELRWDPLWDGVSASPPSSKIAGSGRAVTIDLRVPAGKFTPANNFTVALKPRAMIGAGPNWIAFDDWIVVMLEHDTGQQAHRLSQLYPLNGFGAEAPYSGAADLTGALALQAQKTVSAKVDIDRPPLINPTTNPTLNLDEDGLRGEDIDLHPRNFAIHRASGDNYAYAEVLPTPDNRFTALMPPTPGTTPAYDDVEHGIAGRDINQPGEPVRVFSAIGGQIVNLGVAGTDGKMRISAGANPGPARRH